ncbi:hypothetical protein CHLRE_09g399909v5 [Chlamydomonas reinhardtii]|uniref:Uncharacterized protein n=1 Tax=Chlamydomonas reinhardtii TaxID=3055 RepID=A0A2K3DCW9_CHLRE|nr:uncharacterized protein CHLRE_09g399909v5 [Chlamydomonas reinhardtii]PNW78376.1 hypothetical protein CHLRE_09g399909v5 [Chlamydomonas reinhardtii]
MPPLPASPATDAPGSAHQQLKASRTGDNPATMCLKSQPYRNTNTTGAATTPSCHDNPGRADDL